MLLYVRLRGVRRFLLAENDGMVVELCARSSSDDFGFMQGFRRSTRERGGDDGAIVGQISSSTTLGTKC